MKQNKIFAIALLLLCAVAVSACTSSSALNGNQSWPGLASEGSTVYAANGSFVEAIRDAGIEELAHAPSMNRQAALSVYRFFHDEKGQESSEGSALE